MKIYFFSRPLPSHTAADLSKIVEVTERLGVQLMVNAELAELMQKLCGIVLPHESIFTTLPPLDDVADAIMVSYGGDGTFLEAVRRLAGNQIPLVGVNCGHLGFLSSIPTLNIEEALEEIVGGNFVIEKRSMLEISGDFPVRPPFPYAFNEFSIQRQDTSMIYVDTFAGEQMVARYAGDGIILSTPSGSTAYSLSVGGPIIAPDCNCFVLSPIAPHNLSMRPLVVPDTTELQFTLTSQSPNATVTLDNCIYQVPSNATFRVAKSKKTVFIAKFQNISFFDTLRNKMMWGVDPREK
ncbi:MAG: NADH kinase [Rikenellaceae bacterium]|nr:NADH kinase [Rikenellaceae bacterium]